MQPNQTLHQALTRHLSSNNDIQELLIHLDEDPHTTRQEHQVISSRPGMHCMIVLDQSGQLQGGYRHEQ